MKTESTAFQNTTKRRYLAHIRLLPDLRQEKVRDYTTLALTFFAITFFGLFAINPTLTTITGLQKKLADSKFAELALQQKIANISALRVAHDAVEGDLPYVFAAIPDSPETAMLLAQLQTIARDANVQISDIESFQVDLTKQDTKQSKESSFNFTFIIKGDQNDMAAFLSRITTFERLITVEHIALKKELKEVTQELTIRAKAYFKP